MPAPQPFSRANKFFISVNSEKAGFFLMNNMREFSLFIQQAASGERLITFFSNLSFP